MQKRWYAVVEDNEREVQDWGWGSESLETAKKMAEEQSETAYIAVIEQDEYETFCIGEIRRENGIW